MDSMLTNSENSGKSGKKMKQGLSRIVVLLFAVLLPTTAVAGESEAIQQLKSARELYAAGNWETAREAYRTAFDEAPEGGKLATQALLELSSILWEQGVYAPAEKRARQALSLARKQKDDEALGRLMLTIGHIEASRGKLADASRTLKKCVELTKKSGDRNFELLCSINRRFVRQLRGKPVASESAYREKLAELEKSGEPLLVGTALAKLSELEERRRDFAGGYALLQRAQRQFEKANSVPATARNRLRMAQTLQHLGRWDEAAKKLDGLILLFENMRNRPALVTAYALSGKQAQHAGQLDEARELLTKSLRLSDELDSPQIEANARLALCEFYAEAGEVKRTEELCDAAEVGFQRVGIPHLAGRARVIRARLAQKQQRYRDAREHYLASVKLLESVSSTAKDRRDLAVQRVNLCQVEVNLKATGAFRRCRTAARALTEIDASDPGFREMVAATEFGLGATIDDPKRKLAHFEKAAHIYREIDRPFAGANAYLRLGNARSDVGAGSGAIAAWRMGLAAAGDLEETATLRIELRTRLAQALLDREDFRAAKLVLKRLLDESAELGEVYTRAWAHSAAARADLRLGDRDAAIEHLERGLRLARKTNDEELAKSIENNLEGLRGAAGKE